MTLLVDQATTGLEEIQREAFYVVLDHINDAIGEVEAYWGPRDEALAVRMGVDYEPTLLERVVSENFHEGHRPSLIKAPITAYPNVSVMCFRATPHGESASHDHMDIYRDTLWIEIMVKSEVSEEECNRRAHRMATAVNLCVMANTTLNGIVSGLDATPSANITDLFTRKERSAYGPEWFWQGARLEYAVRKEAAHGSPSSGSFFRAPQYAIDQV
jgi:hypothetical protein